MVNFKIVLTLIYAGFLDGTYSHGGGGLRPPPIHPLINPKLIVKLVHFSMESENATNLWLIGTFPSLFQ